MSDCATRIHHGGTRISKQWGGGKHEQSLVVGGGGDKQGQSLVGASRGKALLGGGCNKQEEKRNINCIAYSFEMMTSDKKMAPCRGGRG